MDEIYLSVVIPVYNEGKRIGKTLDQVLVFLRSQAYRSEIIVVDDGSRDDSVRIAQEKLKGFPNRLLLSERNRGKGHAVRRGMLEASGQFVLFTDADLSVPIEGVKEFLEPLKGGYDYVLGSRALANSRVEIHQSFLREGMGKIFNRIARLFTFRGIRDSQCGFKCFTRKAAQDLFSRQRLDGFCFDAEIIYLAQKSGYRILEAPVMWRNSPQSRVKIFRDPLFMFWDLLRIRWMHRRD